MCRIVLAGRFPDQAVAEECLDRRLRVWLDDYATRSCIDDRAEILDRRGD
jgi:hypothetical protein